MGGASLTTRDNVFDWDAASYDTLPLPHEEWGRRVVDQLDLEPGDRVLVGESQFANKTITILGEVRTRGELAFPIDGKLDLLTAIARAGGYTELANPKKVNVNRKGKVTPVDARDLEKDGATPYLLQPEDVIIVTERRF